MNEEAINPLEQRLNEDDLDVLSGMMVIFAHATERVVQMIELAYEQEYQAGKQYKQLCRLYGKAAVDLRMKTEVKKIIRGDERDKIGKILKCAKEFHRLLQSLNECGRKAHKADITEWDAFDAISHDTNFLCYLYALMGNTTKAEDEVKILSTVKVLAKGNRVSQRIIERLKQSYT